MCFVVFDRCLAIPETQAADARLSVFCNMIWHLEREIIGFGGFLTFFFHFDRNWMHHFSFYRMLEESQSRHVPPYSLSTSMVFLRHGLDTSQPNLTNLVFEQRFLTIATFAPGQDWNIPLGVGIVGTY